MIIKIINIISLKMSISFLDGCAAYAGTALNMLRRYVSGISISGNSTMDAPQYARRWRWRYVSIHNMCQYTCTFSTLCVHIP
jgi:hypothetical protein